MFQVREALILYMMSLTDQVISIETLWNEIASFCDRFAAHRAKVCGASSAAASVVDDAVKKHCVRLLCTMGDELIVVRRLVNASALPDSLRRTGQLIAADLTVCVRVDASFVEKSSFDPRTVVVGATWAAVVRGLGIAAALAQSVAPIANLTDKHLKLIAIVAQGEFRGVLKSFADDQFGDDKKHVSYLVKHLVALGLLRKIDILRPGLASTTAILWLAVFAPPRASPPDLPHGYATTETDAAVKHRITSKIADMPNHIMTNRDIVAGFALRKDRISALREQLVNSGHVQLINAVDHSRDRSRDSSGGGKEQRGLYCWRLLKVFEPKRHHSAVDDSSLTHFSTRPVDAADHIDDAEDANDDDDGADDDEDGGDNNDGAAVVDDGDADALPMRPLCLEMSLDDQILECIRDSGDRGLSAREVCTCLGLNSPHDMKKMVTTLAHLSRDYGFKSEAVYVGKVRFARFKWVENVAEAAIAASSDKFGASVEARARRIADVMAERRAISKASLLQELRELERNPVLDRPTLERAMAHLLRNADQFGGAIRTENVRNGKRTITMFVAANAANNEPAVVAARKAIEDSSKLGPKVDELAVWGEVVDYGEITRLDDAQPISRAGQQRALVAAAALATPNSTGAIGSTIELGLMLQARVLHVAMCSLMAAAPRDGSDVVEVRRVDVFEQLTLDVLLRFFGKRVTQLPDVLSDPRRSEMRLTDLEPAKRDAVESALGSKTSVIAWRRTVQVLLRIGLVEVAPGKAINDAVCVRRSVMASLVPRDGEDSKWRPRRIAFDHSVALKNSMELRRFWMCFERLVRCEDTKSHDISGTVVVECARPAVWVDADRATRDSVLAKYAVLNGVASSVIAAITEVTDDVNIGALTRIAKDAKLTTNDVLTFADAYWRVDIEKQDREAHKSEAAVASKRHAPSSRRDKRVLADEPLERRYLHMTKQSQRRALRRAVLLARHQLDDLEYADDDTEKSETDSDDVDTDDDDDDRVRSRRMADSSDSDESDSVTTERPSRKRVRRSLTQRGAVAGGVAAASERGPAIERGVSAHLTPAQLLSFALVLASRFVERERSNSSAWAKSAPPIVPSTNVPAPLTMVDFGPTDVWREVSAGLRCTRAQSREYFRSAMRTELFPAQLYTQIRRITARLGQHLQSKFAWLHAYVSPLVPDVPLPASVAQLRERCAVYELAPGSATFGLVDPFTVAASSFEAPDAVVLYVADLLVLYLASADDQFVLPIFAAVPAPLRTAALQRLRDRLITARNSSRKKQSDWLLERSIDGERLASAARVRLERHLADFVNISVDEQRKLGKTTEPLLPLAVRDARALQQRLAATPNGVPFSAFEPPGSVLAMLEMVLHGDIAVTHELVPTQTASSSRGGGGGGGARAERAYSLRVTLSERKLADAARDSTTVPFVVAARNEVLVDAAAVLTTLRDLPAARRAFAAASAAGARGLSATELESAFVGPSSSAGVWREQLSTCDLFCSVGEVHYLHGTVAAALFTGDAAPLERVIDTTSQPPSMRYTLRRRDPDSTPLPDGLLSAPPLPVDSNGGRIARRAVLGHYERNPAVRATTLLDRIDDANALLSRVTTGDQLHWLALNHLLVSRRYTEQSWPSGRLCPRLMLSRSAHARHYPPSAALRLTTTQSAIQSLPQLPNVAVKQQQ